MHGHSSTIPTYEDGPGPTQEVARLREVNRLHSELVDLIGRELKTPLNVVAGCSDLLRAHGCLSDHGSQLVDIIHRQRSRMDELVQNLLTTSLLLRSAGVRSASVRSAIVGARLYVLDAYGDDGIVLEMDVDRSRAAIDPRVLEVIVRDLLVHAIDHGSGPVRIRSRTAGSSVELAISCAAKEPDRDADAGPVEPWERGVVTSETEQSSLGLHIAKRFTEIYGGSFVFGDADGQLAFRLILPPAVSAV